MEKILIIEDDKTILMGLKDDLEFEGFRVSSSMDGKEGLKKAPSQMELPELPMSALALSQLSRGRTAPERFFSAIWRPNSMIYGKRRFRWGFENNSRLFFSSAEAGLIGVLADL